MSERPSIFKLSGDLATCKAEVDFLREKCARLEEENDRRPEMCSPEWIYWLYILMGIGGGLAIAGALGAFLLLRDRR